VDFCPRRFKCGSNVVNFIAPFHYVACDGFLYVMNTGALPFRGTREPLGWLQFSLRSLIWLQTLFAVGSGVIGVMMTHSNPIGTALVVWILVAEAYWLAHRVSLFIAHVGVLLFLIVFSLLARLPFPTVFATIFVGSIILAPPVSLYVAIARTCFAPCRIPEDEASKIERLVREKRVALAARRRICR
jgi:hypothetical protein